MGLVRSQRTAEQQPVGGQTGSDLEKDYLDARLHVATSRYKYAQTQSGKAKEDALAQARRDIVITSSMSDFVDDEWFGKFNTLFRDIQTTQMTELIKMDGEAVVEVKDLNRGRKAARPPPRRQNLPTPPPRWPKPPNRKPRREEDSAEVGQHAALCGCGRPAVGGGSGLLRDAVEGQRQNQRQVRARRQGTQVRIHNRPGGDCDSEETATRPQTQSVSSLGESVLTTEPEGLGSLFHLCSNRG